MDNETFKPPYLSFQTLLSFLEALAAKPLPPQIDRSMMDTKSGTDQTNLINALKAFDMISDSFVVKDMLRNFVAADPAARKVLIGQLVQALYPTQLQLSAQNATEKALLDSFTEDFGLAGETRRKAVTFFLHAARWAGLELSPHFPNTRTGSGLPNSGKVKRTRRPKVEKPVITPPAPSGSAGGETKVVQLGDAGTVTVTVNVQWLKLSSDTMVKLRTFVDDLEALADATSTEPSTTGEEVEDDSTEDQP